MKKLILVAIIALASLGVHAQSVNVSVNAGYVFDNKFDSYYDPTEFYNGKIKGGLQWGVAAEYRVQPSVGIEVSYYRQDTHSPTTYLMRGQLLTKFTDFDLGINYIMLGANKYFSSSNSQLEGFAGLSAGVFTAGLTNPDNSNESNVTKFAWGGKLGGIFWASDKVGIKLQMQMLSAVQSVGGGFYFSTGGVGTGVSTYSTIYQFSLGSGLVFNLQ